MFTGIVRRMAAEMLFLGCAGLGGCFISSDNSNDRKLPTVGDELRDLKSARDEGALDPDEYREARQKVLARLDKPRGT